jgi:hypothetical protein
MTKQLNPIKNNKTPQSHKDFLVLSQRGAIVRAGFCGFSNSMIRINNDKTANPRRPKTHVGP